MKTHTLEMSTKNWVGPFPHAQNIEENTKNQSARVRKPHSRATHPTGCRGVSHVVAVQAVREARPAELARDLASARSEVNRQHQRTECWCGRVS